MRSRFVEQAVRQDQVEEELQALHEELREVQLRCARLLARIDKSCHYAFRGCSSIGHYGEISGYSAREARMLAAAGRAVQLKPELVRAITQGEISLDGAALLERIFANPGLAREGEDWLQLARELSSRDLEQAVRTRLLEAASGQPVSILRALLTAPGREKFERARQLASRKKKKALSEGQTVEVLAEHYLHSFDPTRRRPRGRRAADTSAAAGRHVPSDVKRTVWARKGDRCAVPGCDHRIWIEFAHVLPHREGGSREAQNLVYLCRRHHLLYDAGLLSIEGDADAPRFRTSSGESLEGRPALAPDGAGTPRAPPVA